MKVGKRIQKPRGLETKVINPKGRKKDSKTTKVGSKVSSTPKVGKIFINPED